MLSDEQAHEIVRECMTDERPLVVNITIKDAWLLVSALQMATRHPELIVYMKDNLFNTARQFQTQIEAVHPEAHEFIEMGWGTRFDGVDSLDELDAAPIDPMDTGEFEIMSDLDDDEPDCEYPCDDGYGAITKR